MIAQRSADGGRRRVGRNDNPFHAIEAQAVAGRIPREILPNQRCGEGRDGDPRDLATACDIEQQLWTQDESRDRQEDGRPVSRPQSFHIVSVLKDEDGCAGEALTTSPPSPGNLTRRKRHTRGAAVDSGMKKITATLSASAASIGSAGDPSSVSSSVSIGPCIHR